MLLQIAFDQYLLKKVIKIASTIEPYVDFIEVGTPLILYEGMNAVKKFRVLFPNKKLVADIKIADAGALEATIAFDSGADLVTVLGSASFLTIQETKNVAKKFQRQIMLDLLGMKELGEFKEKLKILSGHIVIIHTGYDEAVSSIEIWEKKIQNVVKELKEVSNLNIAIGGGITNKNLSFFLKLNPDLIIIGREVAESQNPILSIRRIRESIDKYNILGK